MRVSIRDPKIRKDRSVFSAKPSRELDKDAKRLVTIEAEVAGLSTLTRQHVAFCVYFQLE